MKKNLTRIVRKPLRLAFLILLLLASMIMVALIAVLNEASATNGTFFYVDPPEVRDVRRGETFSINVTITDAPTTHQWEINLKWNPTVLELATIEDPWGILVYIVEGDFLDRRYYSETEGMWIKNYTTAVYYSPSIAQANLDGEIQIGCYLVEEDDPWANGNGWLCELGFGVKVRQGISVIDLFDTRLWDYLLAQDPAFTYYPNQDGFFYNQDFHDVGIASVTASPTWLEVGGSVTVDVTVRNEGNYTETSSTFNVTVYADKTPYEYEYDIMGRIIRKTIAVGDEIIVGTKTITSQLIKGASTTLSFTWDTTGALLGNYTISAQIKGDDDTRDNLFLNGSVVVTILGDCNGDGKVDRDDLLAFSSAYGSGDPQADFNLDGVVDVRDLTELGKNYGKP